MRLTMVISRWLLPEMPKEHTRASDADKRSQSQGEDSQVAPPWIEVCHFQDFLARVKPEVAIISCGEWNSLWSTPSPGCSGSASGSQCETLSN